MRVSLFTRPLRAPVIGIALVTAVGLAGCADPADPRIYPFELELHREGYKNGVAADLNRDGTDITISFGPSDEPGTDSFLMETLGGDPIEEIPIEGTALQPAALDLDGDDNLELVLPFFHHDSLWVRVSDDLGKVLYDIYIMSGEARVDSTGDVYPWSVASPGLFTEDVDGDGRVELITVAATNRAAAPRGVWIHSLPDGRMMREILVGAALRTRGVRDYDGDGVREIAFGARSPMNGGDAGGLDDSRPYVGIIHLVPRPDSIWAEPLGGRETEPRTFETDLNGDGRYELLTGASNRTSGRGTIQLRDPATRKPIRDIPDSFQRLAPVGGKTRSVLTLNQEGVLTTLDASLQATKARDVSALQPLWLYPIAGYAVGSTPTLGGAAMGANAGTYWVDGDLQIQALLPEVRSYLYEVRWGSETLLAAKHENKLHIYRLRANRWWWLFRYGIEGGFGLMGGLLLVSGSLQWRQHRRIRQLEADLTTRPPSTSAFDETGWRLTARRVAHDLRNPLTSILLTTEQLRMAAEAAGAGEDASRFAARIEERIERLRRVTQNFLKFVDVEALTLSDTDLTAVLHELGDRLRIDLPPDIDLEVHADDPVRLHADADQLVSALENLVANAVNALPEGGRVVLSAYTARGLQINGAPAPRDWAVLEVRDSGTGIAPELRDRLFEPGVTGSSNGAGFGLAVVSKIVADHGGHVEVESEPGAGTVFTLFLPVQPDGDPGSSSSTYVDHEGEHG